MRWLILLLLASPAVAEELPFTVSTMGSGSGPEAAQLADLDGDGDLDVAVVGDTVRWLENDGGSFTSHDIIASYSGGTGLVVGDVDRDGDVDVITTNPATDTIDQALNNGDGTFVLSVIDNTQPDPRSADLFDVNMDGWLDLHIQLDGAGTSRQYLGGSAGFAGSTFLTFGDQCLNHAFADLDRDGDPELISCSPGAVQFTENPTNFNVGNGWLLVDLDTTVTNPKFTQTADFDRDGDLDPAMLHDGGITWRPNAGSSSANWSFGSAETVTGALAGAVQFTAVDLDRDGDVDVAATSPSGDSVHWFENPGTGTGTWNSYGLTGLTGAKHIVGGDVDGDGDVDLVAVGDTSIVLYTNERVHQTVDFGGVNTLNAVIPGPNEGRLADVDTDGDLDFVYAADDSIDRMLWIENTLGNASDWQMIVASTQNLSGPRSAAAADFDRDGDVDLCLASAINDRNHFYENLDATGDSWQAPVQIGSQLDSPRELVLGDIDRDGRIDYIAPGWNDQEIRWYSSATPTAANWPETTIVSGWEPTANLAVEDLDGDGDLDLAATTQNGTVAWFRNDNDGASWNLSVANTGTNPMKDVAAGDLDGDGDHDLVYVESSVGVFWLDNALGDGTVWNAASVNGDTGTDELALLDVDRDGDLDVVTRDGSSTKVAFNVNGDATAWQMTSFVSGMPGTLNLGDLNGDGIEDVTGHDGGADAVYWAEGEFKQIDHTMEDIGDGGVEETVPEAVLSMVVDHTLGSPDDIPVQVDQLPIVLGDDNGTLSNSRAAQYLDELSVWVDDGDGVWDELTDTEVASMTTFVLFGGATSIELSDSDPAVQVPAGTIGTYFLVVHPAATASSVNLGELIVAINGMNGPLVHHSVGDVPVLLDGNPQGAVAYLTVEPFDNDDDGDPATTDCDDNDPLRFTGAVESCDAIDSDCDNDIVDDFPDTDGDLQPNCIDDDDDDNDGDPDATDCADFDDTVFTGATEFCDVTDSDCDGSVVDEFDDTDGDLEPDCTDDDDDGDGDPDVSDCESLDATIFTGAAEACDAVDSDCDGSLVDEFPDFDTDLDPDCTDPDDDGDGDPDASDCDDANALVFSGATEACDTVDSDCDGDLVDEFVDNDGNGTPDCIDDDDDGDGDPDGTDCDPNDPTIYNGAPEVCDGIDQDCDGDIVETFDNSDGDGEPDCFDEDDDGDGDPDVTDCDPLDPTFFAGAPESCDTADNDCDGDLVDGFDDTDGDLDPDCTDLDDDNDTLPDAWEAAGGPNPLYPDDATEDPDGDGRDNLLESADGTLPDEYDGPDAPAPSFPVDGDFVGSPNPELTFTNATSPVGDALVYRVEVYADEDLTELEAVVTDLGETPTETSWTVPANLDEDATYYWRAAASDAYVQGPFSDAEPFVVDAIGDTPTRPEPIFPLTGQVMAFGEEVVEFRASTSPEGLAITYNVELEEVSSGDVIEVSGPASGDAEDAVDVIGLLSPGERYAWRVEAVDPVGRTSGWTAEQEFGFATDNEPPTNPEFTAPEDGASLVSRQPAFLVTASTDPEGGPVVHRLRLDTDPMFDSADLIELELVGEGSGEVRFALATFDVLLTDGNTWHARINAIDAEGAVSAGDNIDVFIRGINDPPPTPELIAPEANEITTQTPTLVIGAVTDPEGDAVTYEFRVTDREGAVLAEGTTASTEWTVDAQLAGGAWWTARAMDEDAASEWAEPLWFVAQDPSWGTGCSSSVAGRGGILLLLLVGLRRRRS